MSSREARTSTSLEQRAGPAWPRRASTVLEALTVALPDSAASGPPWMVDLGAASRAARISLEEDWLVVEAPGRVDRAPACATASASSGWISMLERNGALSGNAKLILDDAKDAALRARAEVPLDPHGESLRPDEEARRRLAARIVAASRGVAEALDPGGAAVATPPRNAAAGGATVDAPADETRIADACRAAGWPADTSPSGDVRVPLESGRAGHRDATFRLGSDGVTIRAQLLPLDAPDLDDRAKAAVALLLLRASGAFRMVRGVAALDSGPVPFLGLEVQLEPDPAPAELGHALSALSVAADETAVEVDALIRDPALAALYLDRMRDAGTARPGERSADPQLQPPKKRRRT